MCKNSFAIYFFNDQLKKINFFPQRTDEICGIFSTSSWQSSFPPSPWHIYKNRDYSSPWAIDDISNFFCVWLTKFTFFSPLWVIDKSNSHSSDFFPHIRLTKFAIIFHDHWRNSWFFNDQYTCFWKTKILSKLFFGWYNFFLYTY